MKIILSLFFVLTIGFSGCGIFQKHPKKKTSARQEEQMRKEMSQVDFQAFVGRLRKAVKAHDFNALAPMMTEDFGYRLNPEGSGPGVFQYWDENNLWEELDGILSEKFVPLENFMVAPPQFADPSLNYDGYRAGICRVNGSWKFAYFVNGPQGR
jgi:hypothetical protein